MATLTKVFKGVSTLIGEVLVAGVGVGAIYAIGYAGGLKKGAKLDSLVDSIKNEIDKNGVKVELTPPEKVEETEVTEEEESEEATPDIQVTTSESEE